MMRVAFLKIGALYRLLRCGSTKVNPLLSGRLD
jgi:hypothetical protein